MSKLPTTQEIIAEFRRRVILFLGLTIGAAFSFMVLMMLAGREGTVLGIPVGVLQVLAVCTTLGAVIGALPLISCPACGNNPSSNSKNIYPARCKSCGVRLR